jgi:hypothetical protein
MLTEYVGATPLDWINTPIDRVLGQEWDTWCLGTCKAADLTRPDQSSAVARASIASGLW